MSSTSDWEFFGATPDGQSFQIGGLNVWKHDWRDTRGRAHVKNPSYHQDFTFHVYEIGSPCAVVAFAAGEFSNRMWRFCVRKPAAKPWLRRTARSRPAWHSDTLDSPPPSFGR